MADDSKVSIVLDNDKKIEEGKEQEKEKANDEDDDEAEKKMTVRGTVNQKDSCEIKNTDVIKPFVFEPTQQTSKLQQCQHSLFVLRQRIVLKVLCHDR